MENLSVISEKLFSLSDAEYKAFTCKLIPNISAESIIGIKTPILRKYAKEIYGSDTAEDFLKILPHRYYEENNLHAFLVEQIKEYDNAIAEIDRFLPFIDNWGTCDSMSPVCFAKNTDKLIADVFRWIDSGQTYVVRFGVCMLMKHYLGDRLKGEYTDKVANIKSDEYYVKMVVAWYFATALTKNYDVSLPYITQYKLEKWVHNKAIQKACESYRISTEKKEYLRTLKIK